MTAVLIRYGTYISLAGQGRAGGLDRSSSISWFGMMVR